MSESVPPETSALPPPAPPLPPSRLGQLQRIIPWGKHIGAKPHGGPGQGEQERALRQMSGLHTSLPSQTTTHRTGIPIAALDINSSGTHAILAGKEILKTVNIHDGKVVEDYNLRASIISYASTHASPQLDGAGRRREYLPARDVRWSTGNYNHIVATAATNGRIALYDINQTGTKTELAWLHEHTGQINKLDFEPFGGYYLLSASQDKSVRLWDMRVPKPEKSFLRFEVRSPVRDVRWSPLQALDFAVCADGGIIQKWDARSPLGPQLSISGHEKACYSIDWHPDGRHVISGGFDKFIRVWDLESDNRRQKPVFQLRAPHAIRNIRWRPPSQVSQTSSSGRWQSTQVAVSYYHDDPRLHIWDLRRPLLPFCELDRYNTPVNDLLWANKDMLWTVGDDGIFTQWDIKHATPLYTSITPSASSFMVDGEYYAFTEDRESRRRASRDDPATGFLSIPRDKLSSGEEVAASRSLTDDEGGLEKTIGVSARRRERSVFHSRSSKSQANSPPSAEDKPPILALDQAILDRGGLFNNDQVGAAGYIPGVAAEPEVVEYLASRYATPASAEERMQSPDTILHRLQEAFDQNARACDKVSMHRMAQSWRVLAAVIVPELREWADTNRAKRRADATRRREALESFRSGANRHGLSPLSGRGFSARPETKSQNLMSSLFKGMVEPDRAHAGSELDSTSNMTTPLVKPLPNSPLVDRKRWSEASSSEDDIDHIVPLPPSVLTSHSTAAAASRALIDSPDGSTKSAPSSPGTARAGGSTTAPSTSSHESTTTPLVPLGKPSPSNPLTQGDNTRQPRNPEDQRAALKDYRIQARPIFTLDDATRRPPAEIGHESGESFPMFSASTDSSHKHPSLGPSFESPREGPKAPSRHDEGDRDSDADEVSEDCSDEDFGSKRPSLDQRPSTDSGPQENASLGMSFGPAGTTLHVVQSAGDKAKTMWTPEDEQQPAPASHMGTAVSTSPDIFHFEDTVALPRPRIYTSNPVRVEDVRPANGHEDHPGHASVKPISMDELDCETYLYQDFRPIDLSRYEPTLPFAWSSLPLICQSIFFDVENGSGHAQFATHLLMHVHPYFFHASFRQPNPAGQMRMEGLVDRLMTPYLGYRVIESIFENHLLFLRHMGLLESAALLRKLCVEYEYPRVYAPAQKNKQASDSLANGDSALLHIVCSDCQSPMPVGSSVCKRCQRMRAACPICLSLRAEADFQSISHMDVATHPWGTNTSMWLFCQACGHSGHVHCLREWFAQPFSEGSCPTRGCGCDCGPGLARQRRIEQQIQRDEEAKLMRGASLSSSATKRDPVRASHSPAVDKARAALRNSSAGERGTQSSDERSLTGTGKRANSRGGMSGLGNPRKSVRLVTPREEGGTSQSRS